MEATVYDGQINEDKLSELISSKPELEVLRHLGDIEVELDGDMSTEDNTFDAPYQEGWVKGGGVDAIVEDLKVTWAPTEKDLEYLQENMEESGLSQRAFDLMKQLVMNEPRSGVSYDITSIIDADALESLENDYVEKHRE